MIARTSRSGAAGPVAVAIRSQSIARQRSLADANHSTSSTWLGRANTAGDAVVYVPDAKVAITGDILVHPFPFATQSYIGEWAVVLRKIEAMDTVAIIPGHGLVMRDKKYLVDIAELMESIMKQARAAYRPGMTVDELRGKIDVEPFRTRIAGTNAFVDANFSAMVKNSAVARAWCSRRSSRLTRASCSCTST